MSEWSPRQKLASVLLVLMLLVSFFTWRALARGVLIEEASSFLIPALWFGLLFLFLLAGALVWQEKVLALLAAIFLVVPSLFQAWGMAHFLIVLFSIGLVWLGLRRVQHELSERIHLSVRRSLAAGLGLLVLGVSLTLSSQYFVHAKSLSWERLVPSFDLAEGVGPLVLHSLRPFSPELASLQDRTVTVDDFLRDVQMKNTERGQLIPPGMQETFWRSELNRTKQELGRLLGREILGTENMQTLLSEVLRKKTVAFFSNEHQSLPVPVLPLFLSVLMFLTLYPLMAFLAPFVGSIVGLVFRLLRHIGWIQVALVSTEREVIER